MTERAADHAAVVLAAGGSRRLGRPKQLLRSDGETLVHRAVRLAAATAPRRLLLVAGAHADAIAEAVVDLPVQVHVNADWQRGLAGSLHRARQALEEAGDDGIARVLWLGCDQPALRADHLQWLLDAAARAPSGCAATDHDGYPGTPAVVPTALLARMPADGDRGLRGVLAEWPWERMGRLRDAALGFDLDTPQQWAEAVSRRWIDPPA
ncbi:nucleotidyltransferase family protein [Luteimonas aquatica]|uniref:nucleotidyltransferase family protein n=1 Tax=Luteimonas aquatica TaxID=450364 RepID=UPI001F562E9F|nr:nucleotidyltransferase family protein [Luteimonas aquatica]